MNEDLWNVKICMGDRHLSLVNLDAGKANYIRSQISARNAGFAYFSVGGSDYNVNRERVDYVSVSRMTP